jgi:hypothetical protein
LERWRVNRSRRTAVSSVLLELALLVTALQAAVHKRERRRKELRKDWWDRHGPDLVNYLPSHLTKALHVLYDEFDTLQHAYALLATPAPTLPPNLREIQASLLGWVYRADFITQRINEHNRRARRLPLPFVRRAPRGDQEGAAFRELTEAADQCARAKLEADGLRLDGTGKLVQVKRDGEWVGYVPSRGDEGHDKA